MKVCLALRAALKCALVVALFVSTRAYAEGHANRGSAPTSTPVVRRIELQELWRVGSDDTAVAFGLVGNAMPLTGGGIAVLDYQQDAVFEFSQRGELVRRVDLSGDGPGRLRCPTDPAMLPDGRIAVAQCFPARIDIFGGNWDYEKSIALSSNNASEEYRIESVMACGEDLVVLGEHITKIQEPGRFLHRRVNFVDVIARSGATLARVYSHERMVDFANNVFDEDHARYVHNVAIGFGGEIYVPTKRNGYEIGVFDARGQQLGRIARGYEPVKRSKEVIKYLTESYHAAMERVFPRFKISISPCEPDISFLEFTTPGELRVTTSRSYAENAAQVFCRYDIYSLRGEFLRYDDVVLPDDEARSGQLRWLDDERIVLITGLVDAARGQDASNSGAQGSLNEMVDDMYDMPMEIVVYRISHIN